MELKYFKFAGEEYKHQVGLKPLDPAEWIEIGPEWSRHVALKESILRDHRPTVLQVLPEADPGCLELHETVARHLSTHFPDMYRFDEGRMSRHGRDFDKPRNGEEALEQITVWTQEDWAVLSPRPPVKLEAGSVCFPSRWSLAEKIGRDSTGIHAHVPKFDGIAKPTQSFLERIMTDKPMWRMNWTIHDSDELFCPGPRPSATDLDDENIIERTFLRIERQTLRRLPATGAVVFSIRTYVHPMRDVVVDPERRRLIGASVRGLPTEIAEYRGMKGFHEILKRVL